MTIGLAIKVPGHGAVIACDSRITDSTGTIITDSDDKSLISGGVVSVFAGSFGGLLVDLRAASPRSLAELRKLTTDKSAGEHDRDYEFLAYDTRDGSLWHLDHQGDALRRGAYAAIGCGSPVALGALGMVSAPKTLEAAERLARKVIKLCAKQHSACGGRTRLIVVSGKRATPR